jgi:hypothetical protein
MYNSDMPTRVELPTSRQLLKSTIIAVIAAVAILVTIVLPAEYAIDPTGIGRALRLTEMGEIKGQLAEEAARDRAADQAPQAAPAPGRQSSLAGRIFAALVIGSAAAQPAAARSEEVRIPLTPGQGIEVKLVMAHGNRLTYNWTVEGGVVNFDFHGDGQGQPSTSYRQGRGVPGAEGTFEAGFAGNHGWFWRNRGRQPVTVVLRVNGEFSAITGVPGR